LNFSVFLLLFLAQSSLWLLPWFALNIVDVTGDFSIGGEITTTSTSDP
jgi:hypothetical protein